MELNDYVCISPMSAKLTRDTSSLTKMTVYCALSIGNTRQKTKTSRITGLYPRWIQEFNFELDGSNTLNIEVWDKRVLSPNKLIGTASITLPLCPATEMEVDLFHENEKAGDIRLLCKTYRGRSILGVENINKI